MKKRLLTNWTWKRWLYLIIGIAVVIQSVLIQNGFGIIFGAYFASMGLFAFSCAAGNCVNGTCATESEKTIQNQETI
jgi:hypothetical protein